MTKKKAFAAMAAAAAFGLGALVVVWLAGSGDDAREPASLASANYESMSGCDKQRELWSRVLGSEHRGTLPAPDKLGAIQLLRMTAQHLSTKRDHFSDFSPPQWRKFLHRRASIAKVKLVPQGSRYSGVFQGAECGLLRLSLTYSTEGGKPVAPGLALKILRDGAPSANVSALVSLEGQGRDFNFFSRPMSNIVPRSSGFGQRLVHRLFSRVSKYPEELLLGDFANVDARGATVSSPESPRQLFFVPAQGLRFASEEHEVRQDFARIPEGSVVYQVRALKPTFSGYDYTSDYGDEEAAKFLAASELIAELVTTSPFVASEFGDDGIFFRHQLRP